MKALRAAFSGQASAPGEIVGVEGAHLLAEAARSGLPLLTVFVRQGSEDQLNAAEMANLQAAQWVLLSRDAFDSAVETESPQGTAGTIAVPEAPADVTPDPTSLFLVLERIQDPGNLGTLLRSAEAFGVNAVFLTHGTANPWNTKCIRASAGSVFRVPMLRRSLAEVRDLHQRADVRWFAAVARTSGATSSTQAELARPCALLVGNEGAGLSQEALRLADELVHVPCAVESLNAAVAGSTLMYEAMRQHLGREDVSAKKLVRA